MTEAVQGEVLQRRRVLIQGIVQGVGFRPFVYAQAHCRGLAGFVYNDCSGVTIEVEGQAEALDAFQRALREELPPLARVDTMTIETIPPCHENTFLITESKMGHARHALISSDSAVCDDCLRELFDPTNRRFSYPFINCTNCGPRFTIVQGIPYDRAKTSMRNFPLCPACRAEYENPLDRRFHAQPNACALCGPQAQFFLWQGEDAHRSLPEPIFQAACHLAQSALLAVKGLGGYHLVCNALDATAVRRLRQRKQRDARPFALMVPDLATAYQLCQVSEAEAELLTSRQRPIVLLARSSTCSVALDVAPSCNTLGLMLPYTPLHYLLLQAFSSTLAPGFPAVLVMTSGNLGAEPIVYRDKQAWEQLKPLADGMLTFNRDIHVRCDDSVMRAIHGGSQVLRRSRGYVPEPLELAFETPVPVLACGGHLKNVFCLSKGRQIFLSHHIGDLENLETLTSYSEGIEHFRQLFGIEPEAIAYDLHPEYLATRYAFDTNIPCKMGIQHHHAHIASVMAEHGLSGPVLGIAADGTGYGTDGAIWGCEVMLVSFSEFQRVAHLAYMTLPGGEQAIHQPWRMAAAYLQQAYGEAFLDLDFPFMQRLDRAKWRTLAQMIAKGLNCPLTSSLGRLFDAVAALLGLPAALSHAEGQFYEGQAAIALEQLASEVSGEDESYPFSIDGQTPAQVDVTPMVRAIVNDIQRGVSASRIARRFHSSVVTLFTQLCVDVRARTGLNVVALSGGVFQNRLLTEQLLDSLESNAFQAYINRRVPPNDAGLSFGQAAIAATRLRERSATDEFSGHAVAMHDW